MFLKVLMLRVFDLYIALYSSSFPSPQPDRTTRRNGFPRGQTGWAYKVYSGSITCCTVVIGIAQFFPGESSQIGSEEPSDKMYWPATSRTEGFCVTSPPELKKPHAGIDAPPLSSSRTQLPGDVCREKERSALELKSLAKMYNGTCSVHEKVHQRDHGTLVFQDHLLLHHDSRKWCRRTAGRRTSAVSKIYRRQCEELNLVK